jgi:hypothetical protein
MDEPSRSSAVGHPGIFSFGVELSVQERLSSLVFPHRRCGSFRLPYTVDIDEHRVGIFAALLSGGPACDLQAGLVSRRGDDHLPRVRTNRLASIQDEIAHEKGKTFPVSASACTPFVTLDCIE